MANGKPNVQTKNEPRPAAKKKNVESQQKRKLKVAVAELEAKAAPQEYDCGPCHAKVAAIAYF